VVAFTTGEPPSLRWLVLPAVVLVHTCFNLGGAFLAARLNDSFRDIQQILPFLFQLFRYVSGVMFPLEVFLSESNTPGVLRVLIDANPLRLMLQSYRWVFMGTPVDVPYLVLAGGISVGLLIVGFIVFRQGEQRYGLR
jgi:teichoic acid transport system permease protein